jgi:hypothetical protein
MLMAIIIASLVGAVFLGAAGGGWFRYKKRRLRASFGPEVATVASEHESVRAVDRELRRRKSLHDDLNLRPISAQDREFYATSWEHLQGEFVDDPSLALITAERLVTTVLETRGYPGADNDEQLALLSVEHADSLAGYRTAQRIGVLAKQGSVVIPTEELRCAMVSYHELFTELLGDPVPSVTGATSEKTTASTRHGQEAST